MNVYLDIDGTLTDVDGLPRPELHNFIEFVTENHNCFWLTTHLMKLEDIDHVYEYLNQIGVPEETMILMKKVQPNPWSILKTNGIDLEKDFLWFDDEVTAMEEEALENAGKLDSLIYVGKNSNVSIGRWLNDNRNIN